MAGTSARPSVTMSTAGENSPWGADHLLAGVGQQHLKVRRRNDRIGCETHRDLGPD